MRKDRESWLSKLRKYVTKGGGGGGGGDQEEEEELSFLYYFRKIFRVSCSVSMAPSPKLALPYYVYRNRDAIASYILAGKISGCLLECTVYVNGNGNDYV